MPDSTPASVGALFRAVEELRADVREDFDKLEQRIADFALVHREIHSAEEKERAAAYERIDVFIHSVEIANAKRDGALGILRWGVELFATHDRSIIGVIFAAAVAILAASGNLHLTIGGP